MSLYLTVGRPSPPQNCRFLWGPGPHLIHGSVGHQSPQPKRHLDWLSRFAGLTSVTDRPRYSVGKDRPHQRT